MAALRWTIEPVLELNPIDALYGLTQQELPTQFQGHWSVFCRFDCEQVLFGPN
jgi:hypothetical protein